MRWQKGGRAGQEIIHIKLFIQKFNYNYISYLLFIHYSFILHSLLNAQNEEGKWSGIMTRRRDGDGSGGVPAGVFPQSFQGGAGEKRIKNEERSIKVKKTSYNGTCWHGSIIRDRR